MNEDKIIEILLKHDERLDWIEENMVTKKDHQEVMGTLDTLVKLANKKDEELTMITHGMKRHQDSIDLLPQTAIAPLPIVAIHGLPGRKIMWHQSPATPTADNVQNGINDVTITPYSMSPTRALPFG